MYRDAASRILDGQANELQQFTDRKIDADSIATIHDTDSLTRIGRPLRLRKAADIA